MAIDEDAGVTVIVKKDGRAQLHLFLLKSGQSLDNEIFTSRSPKTKWLGFYDWLRTRDGIVIGICLHPDEDELHADELKTLVSLQKENSAEEIYIFRPR